MKNRDLSLSLRKWNFLGFVDKCPGDGKRSDSPLPGKKDRFSIGKITSLPSVEELNVGDYSPRNAASDPFYNKRVVYRRNSSPTEIISHINTNLYVFE